MATKFVDHVCISKIMLETDKSNKIEPRENLFVNLVFNLAIPILILRYGNDWAGEKIASLLGKPPNSTSVASIILAVAVLFPVCYGIYDYLRREKINFFSVLGIISALLTGGIGLVPGGTVFMFALKETAIPFVLSIFTIYTLKTPKPLVKLFLYNPAIFDVEKIQSHLSTNGTVSYFEKLLSKCTWLIAGSFVLSAFLNFLLARFIVVTEPFVDKNQFNEEVGAMMFWSFPVISVPCMIISAYTLWLLIKGVKNYAGLDMDQIIGSHLQK